MKRTAVTTLGLFGAAALLCAGRPALAQNDHGNGEGGGPTETRVHSMHTGDAPTAGTTGRSLPSSITAVR